MPAGLSLIKVSKYIKSDKINKKYIHEIFNADANFLEKAQCLKKQLPDRPFSLATQQLDEVMDQSETLL